MLRKVSVTTWHNVVRCAWAGVYETYCDLSNPANQGPGFSWTEALPRQALQSARRHLRMSKMPKHWKDYEAEVLEILEREVKADVQECLERAGIVPRPA